ncbi:MAG: HAMP domain-containing sensor histidine kinase [Planctomycetota bacterium]|nr:HAMP domain-containing sensor histidine kinase [Planctomycetota bacterium]
MHDLRAAPRWSKTAVVVVLVVFGLVLVVAIFGLWAFNSDQEARRSNARTEARAKAQQRLERVQSQVGRYLEGLLKRAVKADEGLAQPLTTAARQRKERKELRDFVERALHGPLVRAVFRVDPEAAGGSIMWPGGRYQLYLGEEHLEARAQRQMEELPQAGDLLNAADEATRTRGHAAALDHWRELVREYGLVAYVEDDEGTDPDQRTPYGLGWAVRMIRCATNALTPDPAAVPPEALHDAVLRALETAVLNAERPRLDGSYTRWKTRDLETALAQLLEKVAPGDRELLAWEMSRFQAFRTEAEVRLRSGQLLGVTNRVAKRGFGNYVEHDDELKPYGVAIAPRGVVVVLLDSQAVAAKVAGTLAGQEAALDSLGMTARMLDVTAKPGASLGPPDSTVALVGQARLPYVLYSWQVGDPADVDGARTDIVLFWAVIALAVAGLVVGGYVLVRLLTREVRLAQLKADFVSNLSHELKTPITSISLFTEMLEEGKLTDGEDQAEAFSVLGQESRRLQRIVHRMIDVARGEARKNPYDLVPGDLNRPVLEAGSRLQRIVTEPGLDLVIQLHPAPLYVQLDRQAMDDAVTNLLSNAWKYKRGERARIVLKTARRGRFAEIVVSDDGIGIPRKDRRKVFEMFYRSEQYLTHPVAGTGLGLALVRSVVAGHRGKISLEPGEGGVGTTFRMRIPLDRKAHAAMTAETAAQLARGEEPLDTADDEAPAHGKVEASSTPQSPSASARTSNPGASS